MPEKTPADEQTHAHTEATLPMTSLPGAPRLEAPTSLGRFELKDVLGRGGMGVVYSAWDPSHERMVAVKLLKHASAATRPHLERFARESAVLCKLQHPGIVSVYETGWQGETPYFVMPLIEGETLSEHVRRRGPLPGVEAASLVRALAAALEHAHDKGIIHRDVKPQNVLLRAADQQPLLLDFGLAHDVAQSTLTRPGEVLGTPLYMSPEQLSGESHSADARTDIYGLGLVLYELLTGTPAFRAPSREQVAERVSQGRFEPPRRLNPAVSRDLEAICLRAIARNRAQRFGAMATLRSDLDRFLAGGTVLARAQLRRQRWQQLRGPGLWLMCGLLLLALASLAGWLAWRQRAIEQRLRAEQGAWQALVDDDPTARTTARQALAERAPQHPALALLDQGLPSAAPVAPSTAQQEQVGALLDEAQRELDGMWRQKSHVCLCACPRPRYYSL